MTPRPSRRPRNRRIRRSGSADYVLEVTTRSSSARRRRRLRVLTWCVRLVALAVLGVGAYVGVREGLDRFFFSNPDYTLRTINLELDGILGREEALETTGLREGLNIFEVDLAALDASLRRISMVRQVAIERTLPDTLSIRLESRDPVAWVAAPGESGDPSASADSLLVDVGGSLMRPRTIHPEFLHLPAIYGVSGETVVEGSRSDHDGLRHALALLDAVTKFPESLLRIRSIDASRDYRLDVVNDAHARIIFDLDDYPGQLARLQKLLLHCAETGRQLESVNLMVRRNTPVKFVVAAADPLPGPSPVRKKSHGKE